MKTRIILLLAVLCLSSLLHAQKTASDYRQAAEKGNAAAQYNLGICYEDGEGVAVDKNTALYMSHKAATNGTTGLAHDCVLVSRNISDFKNIEGLQLIDPYHLSF